MPKITTQPTQFLLHQLATNEQDRDRFNEIAKNYPDTVDFLPLCNELVFGGIAWNYNEQVDEYGEFFTLFLIRTCLSRINGEAVLGVLEGEFTICEEYEYRPYHQRRFEGLENLSEPEYAEWIENDKKANSKTIIILDDLYEAFDYPLRNGKPLDEALQALHDKMLELVPEYVEFINNNK
jgi:hypothetical protein